MRWLRGAAWVLLAAGVLLTIVGLSEEDDRDCGEGRAPGEASCANAPASGGMIVVGALLAFLGLSWLVFDHRARRDAGA